MLTFRHIILWERLTRKPFGRFNGQDEDDIFTLMYCWDDTHQRDTSVAVYRQAARFVAKEKAAFLRDVNRELAFVGQFSNDANDHANDHANRNANGHDSKDVSFTEIFQTLVFRGGISAEWLLSQGMELLPVLAEGMTNQYHEEQSDKKFWTLLQMSPHMTKSGQRKLQNSLVFDWEKEKSGRLTNEQEMALGPALFKGIMKKKEENK